MSKSLGNFKTIRDILEQRQPETLRFFLLGKHYRSPIDFSFDGMDDAERGLKRVYECLAEAERARARAAWKPGTLPDEVTREFDDLNRAFFEALDDDFNTAAALGHVFGIVRLVNRVLEDKPLKNCQGAAELLEKFARAAADWSATLGVFGARPEVFLRELRDTRAGRLGLDTARVENLLAERSEARAAKDFTRADAARDALSALGVQVRDTPEGPVWDIS